jgi:ABC-type transport system involved in multi-copper enzyme maturation permease subunit
MKLLAIIEHTFREGLARKTIIGFFIISSVFLVIALLAAIFTPSTIEMNNPKGVSETIDLIGDEAVVSQIQAFLTGFINFAALVLAIFATASILPNTMEKGSIDLLLSKPLSRNEILFGKTAGSLLIVFANVAYYILGMWLIFGIRTGFWNFGFLAVILSITYTFLVLYAPMLVIGIASRSSALTIIILYVFLFLISPILEGREMLAQIASSDTIKHVLDFFYYPLPKPDALGNLSNTLVMHGKIDWMPVWTSGLSAIGMYVFAIYLFRKKDF